MCVHVCSMWCVVLHRVESSQLSWVNMGLLKAKRGLLEKETHMQPEIEKKVPWQVQGPRVQGPRDQAEGLLWVPARHPSVERVSGGDRPQKLEPPDREHRRTGNVWVTGKDGQHPSGPWDCPKEGLWSRPSAGYLGSNPNSASSKYLALVSPSVNRVHNNPHRTKWLEAQSKCSQKT